MLSKIEQWIDETNRHYESHRISCDKFINEFDGFYTKSFLENAFFVVVNTIPKPDFPGLREMGLGDLIDMHVDGITYKNTYYILPHVVNNLRIHFHELVHVAQWEFLGASNFIERYIREINHHSYEHAPLEEMAYGLDAHYSNGAEKIDIQNYVSEKI
ncbi:hypothetical protein JYB88_05210 [Shewanella cyperi]|uniref:DUF4157 domain-containing protein n=1 Tax=Shewanella cyperi TaxID=2814292 RepID=A0A974XVI0_9GAMM|nr:hypothetical protein [Shewanella cyperi]QSX31044.1 hypothetical protein JYB88_05210 [Shewanella cyperi]